MEYLTVKEIAEKLKVKEDTVYKWIYDDKLESTKIQGIVRITDEQLDRFIKAKAG